MRTCTRANFGVSACSDPHSNCYTAHPTRHFPGHNHKWLKCELYGKVFPSSDAAFAAMDERGYTQPYYRRMSVNWTESGVDYGRSNEFDRRYRYFKHVLKQARRCQPGYFIVANYEIANLKKMATKVRIFHPVANAWTSPHLRSDIKV